MKIKPGYKLRKMCGSSIVVAVGKASSDFNGMVTLNESGELLWNALAEGSDTDALVKLLLSEYPDAVEDKVKADVNSFLETLRKAGLLDE